jgi:hypothetical protein
MRAYGLVFTLMSLVIAPCVQAQQTADSAKALVESGVNAYIRGDAAAAVKAWLKDSAMEGNTQSLSQANILRQIEDFYGRPQGMDLLKEVTLSSHSHLLYFSLNFEKGVAFARFQAYRTGGGKWVMTEFKFNTDASQVLPSSLLGE